MLSKPRILPIETNCLSKEELLTLSVTKPNSEVAKVLSSNPPCNLFLTIAHHYKLFSYWKNFSGYLNSATLNAKDREIIILRTACLTKCDYEWAHHKAIAINVGISESKIKELAKSNISSALFNKKEFNLISAINELYHNSFISDPIWVKLRKSYTNNQLIEIIMLVGLYIQIAYLSNSLQIEIDNWVNY